MHAKFLDGYFHICFPYIWFYIHNVILIFSYGTRETHNKLEKNRSVFRISSFCIHLIQTRSRLHLFPCFSFLIFSCRRAHLKECFERLRAELPGTDDRRASNLATLRTALRHIDVCLSPMKSCTHSDMGPIVHGITDRFSNW